MVKHNKEGNDIETIAEKNGFLGNVIHSKDNTSDIDRLSCKCKCTK